MEQRLLYHYTSQEGFLGIISTKKLWASELQFLNDSREYKIAVERVRDIAESQVKSESAKFRALWFDALDYLDQVPEFHSFVVSFSTKEDSLSQWRGYSRGSPGYCLGFDMEGLKKTAEQHDFRLEKCVYDPAEQDRLISEMITDVRHSWHVEDRRHRFEDSHELMRATSFFLEKLVTIAPLFKDSSFEEEAEWRLISKARSCWDGHIPTRPGRHYLIPYLTYPIETDQKCLLRELTIGPNSYPSLAERGATFSLYRAGLGSVEVKHSVVPYRAV